MGDLPAHAQATLLRVLQEKEIERVGGIKPVKVDVRIIAATNRNLEDLIREGAFRYDLWFRLNVFPIVIPPLRERRSDIPDLVHHFIMKKSQEMNLGGFSVILPGTMEQLMSYHWPGNVRVLENIVERALIRRRAWSRRNRSDSKIFCRDSRRRCMHRGISPRRMRTIGALWMMPCGAISWRPSRGRVEEFMVLAELRTSSASSRTP